ncbi:hypothetical protein ACFQZ4_31400 [Catellatospora coxensis]
MLVHAQGTGEPVKPAYSRWRSRACTVGVHGPALRRTVSPTRTTVLTFPPRSGISVGSWKGAVTMDSSAARRSSARHSSPSRAETN